MVDWNIVASVAGGGYGVTILVLLILAVAAWILGMIAQKIQPEEPKATNKEEGK